MSDLRLRNVKPLGADAVVNRPPRSLVVKEGEAVARDGTCLL
jgi:hypothetical protein